jgi:hypothetical protein
LVFGLTKHGVTLANASGGVNGQLPASIFHGTAALTRDGLTIRRSQRPVDMGQKDLKLQRTERRRAFAK